MPNLSGSFVDKVVENCFSLYSNLPKTGKPIEKEWTVLSCFIKYDRSDGSIEVVSLGTGSKCIGATKMSPKGDVLNDSHAEVFARRGLLIYLYENIAKTFQGESTIFVRENENLKLKDGIEFIFYSSQLPCGDASINPKCGEEELYGDILKPQKRPLEAEEEEMNPKKQKLEADIHRTGAKCLPHCEQDPKETGMNYHLLGQVRTKPGRGDRTLSVSCSDKMAKWIHLGVQGSLLNLICNPIYIKYFIFGAGVPYSEESLQRALLNRNSDCEIKLEIMPEFYQTSLVFSNVRNEDKVRPAAGSIVWMKSDTHTSEVAVQGKKLGVTKKKIHLPSSSLCISKYNIYRKFLNIVNSNVELKQKLCEEHDIESVPYNVMKMKSKRYFDKWLEVKTKFFKTWTVKPDMWDFCINTL
ncbi:adenosine deaminase, tRNA-specific 1 [Anticarsia gemmatalis]|uniref:adenosine deaminase, tRNA-specific 1 n=1 Tax=Anticarsia gemmatalis TaxID=129554 RepID=UPI003F75BC71